MKRKPEKKIRPVPDLNPMTSAIPVHRSTNWVNKPTGSWSFGRFYINPWKVKMEEWIYEYHIFELRMRKYELDRKDIIAVIDTAFTVVKRKPEKKSSLYGFRTLGPLRYRCSALPTELTSQLVILIQYGTVVKTKTSRNWSTIEASKPSYVGFPIYLYAFRGLTYPGRLHEFYFLFSFTRWKRTKFRNTENSRKHRRNDC